MKKFRVLRSGAIGDDYSILYEADSIAHLSINAKKRLAELANQFDYADYETAEKVLIQEGFMMNRILNFIARNLPHAFWQREIVKSGFLCTLIGHDIKRVPILHSLGRVNLICRRCGERVGSANDWN